MTQVVNLGATARVSATFRDASDGTLIDQGGIAAVVTRPDGTDTSYSGQIVHDSTGVYHLDLVTDQAGTWRGKFVGDTDVVPFSFDVARDYTDDTTTPVTVGPAVQFAVPEDLAARLGVTFTDVDTARADTLLTLASGLIQDAVDQVVALVEDDTLTRPGSYDDRVRLPERPVVSVASVTLNGEVLTEGTDWFLDGDEIVRNRRLATLEWWGHRFGFYGPGFLGPQYSLEIVYTHGYAAVPPLVRATCLEMVSRVWNNPGSVVSETYGSEMVTYQTGSTGLLLTDAERTRIERLLRRTAGSIRLR